VSREREEIQEAIGGAQVHVDVQEPACRCGSPVKQNSAKSIAEIMFTSAGD
jgi:hypothetical protein